MPTVGVPELLIILVLAMLVFGAGKLPEMGKSLGKGLREFRKAQSEIDELRKPITLDTLLGPETKAKSSTEEEAKSEK